MKAVESLSVPEINDDNKNSKPLLEGKLDIVAGVKVKLEVRIGKAELTVEELMALGQGSTVQLTKPVSAPVELLLDNRVVALGKLVAAEENFGIQITELLS